MTHTLPPNLLAMFQPRPPVRFLEPVPKHPQRDLSGIARLTAEFTPDAPTVTKSVLLPHRLSFNVQEPKDVVLSRDTLRKRKREERQKEHQARLKQKLEECSPNPFPEQLCTNNSRGSEKQL